MKFPDRSSSSRKKRTNKIEIDFNSLIAQGLQRDRDKRPRSRNAGGGPRRQLEDQKIFFKMSSILKLMRKQELMFKRITKLMREQWIFKLLQRYKCYNVVKSMCCVLQEHNYVLLCVYFCLLCKKYGWTKGDAFCNQEKNIFSITSLPIAILNHKQACY